MSFLQKWKSKIWLGGVTLGVICLVVGAYAGQLEDMYRKAIMICLECIGIG